MSICRICKTDVDKYTTMFGYCYDCQIKLGGKTNTKEYQMNKIKWNVEEEKGFLYDAKEYIICKDCGYLVKNPDEILKKCPSCGISYEQSLSVIVNN